MEDEMEYLKSRVNKLEKTQKEIIEYIEENFKQVYKVLKEKGVITKEDIDKFLAERKETAMKENFDFMRSLFKETKED